MNSTDGIKQRCKFCKHEWTYTGDNDKSTCSNCSRKNWTLQAYERWLDYNIETEQ